MELKKPRRRKEIGEMKVKKKALALKTRTEWHHFGVSCLEFQVNWSTDLNLSRLVLTRKF